MVTEKRAAGATAAEAAAEINADLRHKEDIRITGSNQMATLHHMLVARWKVLYQTAQGNWEGPMQSHIDSLPDGHSVKAGWGQLLAFLNFLDQWAYPSKDNEIAGIIEYLIPVAASVSPVTGITEADVRQDVYDVTQGPQIPRTDYTEAEIQAIYDELDAADAAAAAAAARAADVQRATDHFAAITAGLEADQMAAYEAAQPAIDDARVHQSNAAASLADVDHLTDAELTARVDAVIATSDGVLA